MNHEEEIKRAMRGLKEKYKGKAVRLQPEPGKIPDVYQVHIRPLHAETTEDLDWNLAETGQLEYIIRNSRF